MSVLFLSCMYDSVVRSMCCSTCGNITEIHEAGTSCQDVWIVLIICVTIVLVAWIAKCAVLSWKEKEINAANNEREAKEKEKDIADRKKKADALNKLIDYLKKNTSEEKEIAGKTVKSEKGLDSDEGKYYMKVLIDVINGKEIPDYPLKKQNNEDETAQSH